MEVEYFYKIAISELSKFKFLTPKNFQKKITFLKDC